MILARFESQFQIGAQESSPEFGHQFFYSVALAPEPMPTEVPVKPALAAGPAHKFMGEDRIVAIRVLEALERRHLDRISGYAVKRTIAAVPDGRTRGSEELVHLPDAGDRIERRCGFGVIDLRQTIDLLDIEDDVALQKRDLAVDFVACLVVSLLACDVVHVHNQRAFLALADMGIQLRGLFEGHPDRSREVLRHRTGPQREHVDSTVGLTVVAKRTSDPSCRVFGVPRPDPGPHTLFQVADDLVGDPAVDVLLFLVPHCLSPLRARFKTSCPRNGAGLQGGLSRHRVAGLWLAKALPLTAQRSSLLVVAHEGTRVKTRREQGRTMNGFEQATALGPKRYNRDRMLACITAMVLDLEREMPKIRAIALQR